jgi:hypothetical protein
MEMGREARLLLRLGMARLKGLDALRVVIESRLELKDVVTVRRGFLGEDIVMMVRRKSYAAIYTHGHYCWHRYAFLASKATSIFASQH